VFLAACGSSSAFTNASPLETTSGEQDLASAPIAANEDAGADAPAGCYCPDVTVRCGTSGAFHARADRSTCTLDLPATACALFGFETGSVAHPEAILATVAPSDLSADDVFELCSAKHEAHHACDRAMGGLLCAFELPAYDVTLECMRAFAADVKVAHNIEGVLAAREMNACLCDGTQCTSCTARCKTSHPMFATTCDQAESVYCP
jgi:hypothetical protein